VRMPEATPHMHALCVCMCAGEAENLLTLMAEGNRQAGKNNIKAGGSAVTARKLGKVCACVGACRRAG